MENIKNLTSYVLKAFTRHNSIMDESSDDDSEIEITDIVIVPAPSHTSKAKFVSKLRKFAKNHFDLIVEENSQVKEEIVEEAKSTSKAVVVSSPVNAEHIQIKLQPPKPTTKRSSHVMINCNNVRRDQVIIISMSEKYHIVRNLHFLSKYSTLISRENFRFFWGEKFVKMLWF